MSISEPTAEQLAALAARPVDAPVVMVNLVKFKQPDGLQRYVQYGREVAPHLDRVGAVIRYSGVAPTFILGEGEKPWWDAIVIAEYPSLAAFMAMVTSPDYAAVQEHRTAALERGELIATSPAPPAAD